MDAHGSLDPAAWRDPLTGLEGPDAWRRTLVVEMARAARYGHSLTVVVLEVQGVVDLLGDRGTSDSRRAFRTVAQALRRASRTSDLVFRIGATRFGVVLTETDEVAAVNYVERVRERVPPLVSAAGGGARLSFGWASPVSGESADVLVRRADRRLSGDLLR